jgi:hypothetical protein
MVKPIRAHLAEMFARHRKPLGLALAAELEAMLTLAFEAGKLEANEQQLAVGDVVQLDPDGGCAWGPLFAIVDKVYDWGVRADFFVPGKRGEAPGVAPIRVDKGKYWRIGRAVWLPSDEGRQDTP